MRWFTIAFFVTLASIVSCSPLGLIQYANVTKPSQDPFYTPRSGYENLTLGTIIDYRKIDHPYGLIAFKANIEAAYQFLVRSEDSHGNPNAIVTTVLVPVNANPSKVVSYHTFEDSSSVDCAPSYASQIGAAPFAWGTNLEQIMSYSALYEGWYLVIPDQLGPKTVWAVGLQAGYATLNSMKAVLSSGNITGIHSDAKVAFWGYSGGTTPSIWGAALAPTYAPEIDLIGVAVGGIMADPSQLVDVCMGTFKSGLVNVVFSGWANEYPDFSTYLNSTLYPNIKDQFLQPGCSVNILAANAWNKWSDISDQDIYNSSEYQKIAFANSILNLNSSTPKAPFFFYNGKPDGTVPADSANRLYDKWCKLNVSIEYHQDKISDHAVGLITGVGGAFEWIKERFDGEPQYGCQKTESFSLLFNYNSVAGTIEILGNVVRLIIGTPTGPNSPAGSNSTSISSYLLTFGESVLPSFLGSNSTNIFSIFGTVFTSLAPEIFGETKSNTSSIITTIIDSIFPSLNHTKSSNSTSSGSSSVLTSIIDFILPHSNSTKSASKPATTSTAKPVATSATKPSNSTSSGSSVLSSIFDSLLGGSKSTNSTTSSSPSILNSILKVIF